MFHRVSRSEIMDTVSHLRGLHRQIKPANEQESRTAERREILIRHLISNLNRISEHPTLTLVLQISELLSLTVEGAHRMFGYNLGSMREYDMRLNGGRTHIVESYIFERDRIVDVPSEFAAAEAFRSDATLGDLIRRWQYDVPVRSLRGRGWSRPGAFYIHVGTKDSAGTSLPAGSLALVEPIGREEESRPNPRAIYLLQFGDGYRCSHCVVTRGKLQLISRARTHRNLEFLYGHTVRIVGRIRMFALALPQPEYELDGNLVPYRGTAALLLPWEHSSRAQLLATKYKRFRRTHEEEAAVREFLEQQLQTQMSARTERRYRNNDTSEPHVSGLMHLTIAHFARYSDSLRISGATVTDKGRFSLEAARNANYLADLYDLQHRQVSAPGPPEVWDARRLEFVEWPSLLSLKFPQLRRWDDRVIRVAEGISMQGLEPPIAPGSWLLLERLATAPDTHSDATKRGWSRPFYVFRRGLKMFYGYLQRDGNCYTLLTHPSEANSRVTFRHDELHALSRVCGIAVPV